jgi:hypothetical protein
MAIHIGFLKGLTQGHHRWKRRLNGGGHVGARRFIAAMENLQRRGITVLSNCRTPLKDGRCCGHRS